MKLKLRKQSDQPAWMGVGLAKAEPRPELLLLPNIPKPLHGVAPRVIMGEKWWNTEREKAYRSAGYHCAACGIIKYEAKYHPWLEAHEVYKTNYAKGRMTFIEVVPLCHACHNYIHCGRMSSLVGKGEMEESKETAILKHGDALLRKARLKRNDVGGLVAPWSAWRLVFNGKLYPPKFKSIRAWAKNYGMDIQDVDEF